MRIIFKKLTNALISLIIFGITVCGIVNAQNICCNEKLNSCNPISKGIVGADAADNISSRSLMHNQSDRIRTNTCSKQNMASFGSGQECCEIDYYELYNIDKHISPAVTKAAYSSQLNEYIEKSIIDSDHKFELYYQPYSTMAVPIYILTLSIIC